MTNHATAYISLGGNSNPPVLQAGPTFTDTLDAMERPVSLTSNQAAGILAQNVVYNAADQITQMDRARGGGLMSTEYRTYNALLQVTAVSESHSLYNYGYTYSATQNNGRILQSTDAAAGQTINYTYDTLNRLATASGTGWAESYTYDGFGNLTDKTPTAGSPPVLHVAVNAANNQLVGYAYDANGNMTSIPGTASFTYDVRNHIVSAYPSSGGTEQYSYSPDNLRVWKLTPAGGEELDFYGAFGERLGVYPIVNFSPYGYYVFQGPINGYFAGKIIWSQQTGSNGSVVSGTGLEVAQNRLGSVAGSYPNGTYYYPYGEDTGTPLLGENFATYYRDGTTGLDYARNRYYSPILGRFLSPDLGNPGYLSNPQSLNRYIYVLDDPINSRDPEGLCTVMIGGITQTPYTPDVTAQQDVAESLGAISAFPYAGGSESGGIGNILAQGAGVPTGAVLTTLEAISLAAQNKGPIDIIAYSGGAQSFTEAWNYLNADVKSRIDSITYVDPATTGTLTAGNPGTWGNPGTTVKVLEDNTGFVNTALQFLGSGKPTNPNPPGAEYVDTFGCGHNANCAFAKFLDWFSGSSCKIGAGGVFGAPTSHGVQVMPITGSLTGPPAMVYWWEVPPVPSVTTKITYDVP